MNFSELVNTNANQIAFIVGNGINRYANPSSMMSWEGLLETLWKKFSKDNFETVPRGITYTEFYDLLEISCNRSLTKENVVKKEVCRLLESWTFTNNHLLFVEKHAHWVRPS